MSEEGWQARSHSKELETPIHGPVHLCKEFERTGWGEEDSSAVSWFQLEKVKGIFQEEAEIEKILLMTLSSKSHSARIWAVGQGWGVGGREGLKMYKA